MQKCDLIIKGKYILTMNDKAEIIEDGAIIVQDKKIIAIDTQKNIVDKYQTDEIIDAGNSIIMPGLINAHTHVPMSYFRGLADDLQLDEWLNKHIWPQEAKHVKPEFVKKSTELGCLEMIKAGVTCFNDMYFFEEEVAEVVKNFGMRAVVGEGIIDFPTPSCAKPKLAIEKTINLIEKFKDDELMKVAFAPHSIYICQKEILEQIKDLALKHNTLVHIHLSETKKEYDEALSKYQLTPTQYLDSFGFLNKNVVAAHCVWLNDNDLKILADAGVKIAHNPISNMKLVSGMARIEEAGKKYNIVVSLGTDGVASNNTQDLFTDMRVAALMHKIKNEDASAATAEDIVKMATINGAKTLNWDDKIGSLEVGKQADLITINLDQPHLQPIYNLYSHLVYCVNAGDVNDVVINGQVVIRDRKLKNVDEEKILEEAKKFNI